MTPTDRTALLLRVVSCILFALAVIVVTVSRFHTDARTWGGLVAGGLLAFVLSTF